MFDLAEPAGAPACEEGAHAAIVNCIEAEGWCVSDAFLPPLLMHELAMQCRTEWDAGGFRLAGVGRGADLKVRPEMRTDRVRWLRGDESGALALYLRALDHLRQAINRALFLGLFGFEGHFALYPPGSYYRRHLDQFHASGDRVLTCILYLNEDWQGENGGQLRLYVDPADEGKFVDIEPLGGRLVTFFSARFQHEVLTAGAERMSLTGWLKRRG